jgi:large subunit ribosomal protein L21e
MVRKSFGKMRGSRHKMTLHRRPTVNSFLQKFNIGDKVVIDAATGKNFVHPNFQGFTGTVLSQRGRSYCVQIREKRALKTVFMKPEHLRLHK